MSVVISKKMLEEAVSFHGHLGPFLVLGLRMSLHASEVFGGKPERCEIETINRKPYLCTVDGVKTVMGNNVTVREGDGLVARFSATAGKETVVRVKGDIVRKYAEGPWEKCEEYAYEVIRSENAQLFE